MAGEDNQAGNVIPEYNNATTGLNLDQTVNQVPKGKLTYALNAAVENFDSNSVNYQNEPGNEFCLHFPTNYRLIGEHFISEQNKHIFFLVNPETGRSQIGYMDNNDCIYNIYIDAPCLAFNIDYPIHKVVHKITNCTTEIYWTDGLNPRRYLDLNNIPYIIDPGATLCDPVYLNEVDCNQLKLQPNFSIPALDIVEITTGGDLTAGTYQFAIQYSDAAGNPYTSYYSVTNPTPIANIQLTTLDFNYQVGRAIRLTISKLDSTGQFQYFNLAVIKTINAITSVELVGTYFIDQIEKTLTYTGQNVTQIRLTINDIFEKYPYYEIAQDLTAVQDILVWDQLTSIDKVNYQSIASQITLQWETYRIPSTENYSDALNATNLRGYLRDEVYAFEIVFLLKNGKQTDGFHIPGRTSIPSDLVSVYKDGPNANADFIGTPVYEDPVTGVGYSPYWKIYNTASVGQFSPEFTPGTNYKGPYQYGDFAYWESGDEYPCNTDVWGDLAGQKIRHHKFPDVLVSPIFETPTISSYNGLVMQNDAVFPIGVKIDIEQVYRLIRASSLTKSQIDDIAAFKIVRGDRATNRSIVAKGILRNVGKYDKEGTSYYYPNYPYNDLKEDPFLLDKNNAYTVQSNVNSTQGVCRKFNVTVYESGFIEYLDCFTNVLGSHAMVAGVELNFCALGIPKVLSGKAYVKSLTYKTYSLKLNFADIAYNQVRVKYISPGFCTPVPYAAIPSRFPACGSYALAAALPYNCAYGVAGMTACLTGDYMAVTLMANPPITTSTILIDSLVEPLFVSGSTNYELKEVSSTGYDATCTALPLKGFTTDNGSDYRHVFNSPETSFGQPFLGGVIKLESAIFGAGSAHFVQVKKNSLYKLISKEAEEDAFNSSVAIANITSPLNAQALFAAYQSYLTIYINGITRRNYAYSFNSIASYNYAADIANGLGVKQRELDISQYLIPGVQGVGDTYSVNNFERESSVYLKTAASNTALPFPDKTPSLVVGTTSLITDDSRFVASKDNGCTTPSKERYINVVSYYGSLKNVFDNQWGQIYSYVTIDTGFQRNIQTVDILSGQPSTGTIFGGDTFISRFAFKTKLPFFIDNRVGAPDDSDIYFDEIGNVGYPEYWFSARSILSNISANGISLTNFISYKAHNFDCPNSQTPATNNPSRTYYDGKMYLFAYGIPSFYCESSINTDLRQAFNNLEGDFWPHVSTSIPDDWLQESYVSIAFDNTYHYNVTYSRQNKENFFSHLPPDWKAQLCFTNYPFRAIYSDTQVVNADNRVNNWLTYRATSMFDFPQNYGDLTSLDGIQNKAVLARFDNKSLLYNTMLTIQTSNPQAAYLGNDTLFKSAPPIDFAETDLGYVGSQNKMLLKIPQGQITIDAKRGQVFLISGNQAQDLSAFGSGLNRFFTDHLAFEILRYFPDREEIINNERIVIKGVDTDNHFNGCGLHGVFDSKYDRVIISKLDYIPLFDTIKYNSVTRDFYIIENPTTAPLVKVVNLTDSEYFCNKSWTLSFNMNTQSWISFHSYIPNWYVAENNFFYSGLNEGCDLEALAINEVPITSTTTTTARPPLPPEPTTTTTSTTINCNLDGDAVAIDCRLAGEAVVPDCNFVITALEVTTTTTTTTIPPTTTTTSTSTSTSTSTTTTTTTIPPTTTTTTTCPIPTLYLASTSNDACNQINGQFLIGISYTTTGTCYYCNWDTLNSTTIPSLADGTYYVSDGTNIRSWTKTSTPSQLYAPSACSTCPGVTTTTTTTTVPPTTTTTTTVAPPPPTTTTTTTMAVSIATIAFDFYDDGSGIISARATVTSGTTLDNILFTGTVNGYQSSGCSGVQITNTSLSGTLPATNTTADTEVFGSISAVVSAQYAPLIVNGNTISVFSQDITVGGHIYTITGGTNCYSSL